MKGYSSIKEFYKFCFNDSLILSFRRTYLELVFVNYS